jgi:outer membrane protein TolC
MELSWSVLALALIGAQDQQPGQPKPPSSSSAVETKPCDPKPFGTPACQKASSESVENAVLLPLKMPKVAKPRTIVDPEEAPECWPMTLDEAIRIALDNSETVRVIDFGRFGNSLVGLMGCPGEPPLRYSTGPMVIARLNADASQWRFKAEIMAEIRSFEQQYWNLAQAHVQLWAADRAVSLAQEVLNREQAELQIGRGTVADVAEATQRLEQLNLDLVTRTSDVITTERQLRNLLGLPPADNRRIIPVTPPAEECVEFDWDTCLNEMMEEQPDIVQQKLLVRIAELQLLIARNQLVPELSLNTLHQLNSLGQFDEAFALTNNIILNALQLVLANSEKAATLDGKTVNDTGFLTSQVGYCLQLQGGGGRSPLANSRQAQYVLLRSRAYLQQVLHQTTHSLARFFLEVDANYKQYKTASRLREAAANRLDAQRAYYEEGRITIDRFLDSVSQYATAVATEARYKTTYNIALAALSEAKGTLLADRGIVVAEGPRTRRPCNRREPANPTIPGVGPILIHADHPAKPTTPRWAEVIPVTRRAGRLDRQTLPASFEPDKVLRVGGPDISAIHVIPRAPCPVVARADEAWIGLSPRSQGAPTQSADVSTKVQAACTTSSCETGKGIARADTTGTTAKAEQPAKAEPASRTKTWTFSLSIGAGARPLQIKGTITQTETDDPGVPKP